MFGDLDLLIGDALGLGPTQSNPGHRQTETQTQAQSKPGSGPIENPAPGAIEAWLPSPTQSKLGSGPISNTSHIPIVTWPRCNRNPALFNRKTSRWRNRNPTANLRPAANRRANCRPANRRPTTRCPKRSPTNPCQTPWHKNIELGRGSGSVGLSALGNHKSARLIRVCKSRDKRNDAPLGRGQEVVLTLATSALVSTWASRPR